MSWKKYFRVANNTTGALSPIHGNKGSLVNPGFTNYGSLLPEVYAGHPNRVERYSQYEVMDLDSEVNAALDILAEFCTQPNEDNESFQLNFKEDPTETETKILTKEMQTWCSLNNFENLTVTQIAADTIYHPNTTGGGGGTATGVAGYNSQLQGGGSGGRFTMGARDLAIDAKNIVHLSLTEGLDLNWPFGRSILEQIFKVYKQKELLEDAIIIYRVQRAPERRVFKIDTGNMPSHMAMQFVERVKNEIHQRRIPSASGGSSSVIDSSYNPLSIGEDFYFPHTSEGRGSKVETLPGGSSLGEIDDLRYFTNKLMRALRIPSSYLPTGADDSQGQYNDGRVGTAYIQELRFNKYCERLQQLLISHFDREFKNYLSNKGVNIDFSLFDLKFQSPQNFASYRQAELDNQRIGTFAQIVAMPFVSKRFALKRFLGMTEEDIAENERMWAEENGDTTSTPADASSELRSAGITPSGIESDVG